MATEEKTKPTGLFDGIVSKIFRPKPSGVTCEYCGWNGSKDDLLKSPRLNEDGTVYQLATCPSCLRNGGLIYHD